jgi:hypothetical protein
MRSTKNNPTPDMTQNTLSVIFIAHPTGTATTNQDQIAT